MDNQGNLRQRARRALGTTPDKHAICYHGLWYDWDWVRDCGACVMELLEGTENDSRPVGLVTRNRPTSIAALLALMAAGRSARMIFAFQSPTALARELSRGDLSAVIASDEDFSRPVLSALAGAAIPAISIDEEAGVGPIGETAEREPPVRALQLEPAIEMLTSGTSGHPRHFRLTHDMILRGFLNCNLNYAALQTEPDAAALLFFPLGTVSGLYSFLPPALDGRAMILLDKFDLDAWLDYVATYRPHRGSLPPTGVETLLNRDIPVEELYNIQYIGTGAAPIDADTQREFEERYDIPLLISYGATEFGGPVAAMTAELHHEWGAAKRGSAGRAWGGAHLRIIDPATGAECAPGTTGILEVVAPTVGMDWVRTTDLARIDEDGFLYHVGRADGAISRGGFSILPEVIERAVRSHPGVLAASVVGLPHRRLGEVPVAAVQPRDPDNPPDAAELERHVRDQVYATHVPVQFRMVRSLPRTGSMKVDRGKVRAMFEREFLPEEAGRQ